MSLLYNEQRPVDPLGDADAENEKQVKHNRAKVGSGRPSSLLKAFRLGCHGNGRSWTFGARMWVRTACRSRGAWICGGSASRRRQIRFQSSRPVGMIVNWGRSMIAPGP